MHHRPHPLLAAAVAVALCAALAPARGQTPAPPTAPVPPPPSAAGVHTDAAGNLHVNTAANQTVLINGVDFVGELAALKAALAALATPSPNPAPGKVFSNASQVKVVASDAAARAYFGHSVAISGSTMAVGAYGDAGSGSAYVFTHNGTAWVQQQKLFGSDTRADDWFGFSVALDGATLVVGAQRHDDGAIDDGAAYVFTRSNGGAWTQQQKLTSTHGRRDDGFGSTVAISGNTIVVGVHAADLEYRNVGSVFVFERTGSTWTEQDWILAADRAESDEFGSSVVLAGNTLFVGSPFDDDAGTDSGSVYVYQRSGTTWARQQKLLAADAATHNQFGSSVAVSGNTMVVGAWNDDRTVIGSGSAYVFTRTGTDWTQQAKLAASDPLRGAAFGFSVAVSGDIIVVGAFRDTGFSGSAYVFARTGSTWTETKLTALDAASDDQFGTSAAISGNTIVAGAYANDDAGRDSGSVYVF